MAILFSLSVGANEMLVAKIAGSRVELYESQSRALKRVISVSAYKGATHAEIRGDEIAVTCGDGRVRIFNVQTAALKSVI